MFPPLFYHVSNCLKNFSLFLGKIKQLILKQYKSLSNVYEVYFNVMNAMLVRGAFGLAGTQFIRNAHGNSSTCNITSNICQVYFKSKNAILVRGEILCQGSILGTAEPVTTSQVMCDENT
jgi:hypothetical protein